MGEGKLSHTLLDLDFFCALGTTEKVGKQRKILGRGPKYRFDHNNGVTVVNDEVGRPWIIKDNLVNGQSESVDVQYKFRRVRSECHLILGAYVPHSNDGGLFVNTVLPDLLQLGSFTRVDPKF